MHTKFILIYQYSREISDFKQNMQMEMPKRHINPVLKAQTRCCINHINFTFTSAKSGEYLKIYDWNFNMPLLFLLTKNIWFLFLHVSVLWKGRSGLLSQRYTSNYQAHWLEIKIRQDTEQQERKSISIHVHFAVSLLVIESKCFSLDIRLNKAQR